jgi:hypothetical protein
MKKHVKRCLFFLLVLSIFVSAVAGCRSEVKEVDLAAMSKELLDSGAFTDLLSAVDTETAATLYGLDVGDVKSCTVYCGTGATAEEIALFLAADTAAAGRIKTAADARIQHQITAYESYVPAEVPKLEAALVRQTGPYVFCVVSADTDAAKAVVDRCSE